jgi:anti-anti-sigma regulatory factor
MLKLNVEKIGDVAIIECEGKIVRGESAIKLRDVVMSQRDAHTVVIELSEVRALEGGGLGVLVFLQRWACAHNIRLKLFNPSQSVHERLQLVSPLAKFDIPTLHEMIRLLGRADSYYYAIAA